MAFSDTLTLENAFNAANSFAKTSQDASGSRYIDTASTPAEPRLLVIKHQLSGKGTSAVDRHLVQASYQKLDAEGDPFTGVVNVTMAQPRSAAITSTIMYNLIANLIDLLTSATFASTHTALTTTNIDKLLRGEQ